MEAIAYFITISSSFIDSLCNSCSACLLSTVHPGNMPLHFVYGANFSTKILFWALQVLNLPPKNVLPLIQIIANFKLY